MADCAPFGTYSFANVAFSIDGALVIGFDEGDDCIMIEPTTELGQAKVGADGTSILSITTDQSATVTIKLMANSPFNAYLRSKVSRMRQGGLTGLTFPIGFTDLSSRETGGCTQAIVMTEPSLMRGANVNSQEWKLFCPCWQPGSVEVVTG
jgi:hypothetical protein